MSVTLSLSQEPNWVKDGHVGNINYRLRWGGAIEEIKHTNTLYFDVPVMDLSFRTGRFGQTV